MAFSTTKHLRFGLLLLLSALLLAGCSKPGDVAARAAQQGMSDVPGSGDLAPDFIIPLLDGGTVQLSNLRGKPVVLYFWATWCGSCVYDMPIIDDVYREKAGKEATLLTVNVGQSQLEVQKFVDEGEYEIPFGLDGGMEIGRAYRLLGFPSTYFIDSAGNIRRVRVGPISRDGLLEQLAQIQ